MNGYVSKLAQVTPILKKPGLPSTDPANFRPISNLNNISKILERLFLSRLLPHINSSSNFNSFQSAYRPHHFTETALTFTLDNVFHAADTGSATLLVSLDLSAAFDSINHNILISRLSSCFGLTGLALDWISSYLHNRRQSVKIGDACSPPFDITSGMPHGVRPGPNPFRSLHLAYLGHRGCSWCPATITICRWHPTLHLCIRQNYST